MPSVTLTADNFMATSVCSENRHSSPLFELAEMHSPREHFSLCILNKFVPVYFFKFYFLMTFILRNRNVIHSDLN